MNYKEKLKAVETFEGLFDLREELRAEERRLTENEKNSKSEGSMFDNLEHHQEVNFWLARVTNRIESMEQKGNCLDKIQPLDKKGNGTTVGMVIRSQNKKLSLEMAMQLEKRPHYAEDLIKEAKLIEQHLNGEQ